jgi:hypothetical protein
MSRHHATPTTHHTRRGKAIKQKKDHDETDGDKKDPRQETKKERERERERP